MYKRNEIVGVLGWQERFDWVDLVLFLKVRPSIPVGAIYRVAMTILIDVTQARAFGVKLVGQLDFFEGDRFVLCTNRCSENS